MKEVDKTIWILVLLMSVVFMVPFIYKFLFLALPFIAMCIGVLLVAKGMVGKGPWNWWR